MKRHTIVSMPGDGIGKVVLPEAVRVLQGGGLTRTTSTAISAGTSGSRGQRPARPDHRAIRKHRLGLFGAITSKPKKEGDAELDPQLRGKGHTYYSPIVTMRQLFDLDLCVRPCRSFPGNPLNFIRKKVDGGFEEPVVDVVIFRQGTEGSTRASSGPTRRRRCGTPSPRTPSSSPSKT